MSELIEVNKYGAVDVRDIQRIQTKIEYLKERCGRLEDIIIEIAGGEDYLYHRFVPDSPFVSWTYGHLDLATKALSEDIKKMRELTKSDDYEYKTTPEKEKLVKKGKHGK